MEKRMTVEEILKAKIEMELEIRRIHGRNSITSWKIKCILRNGMINA